MNSYIHNGCEKSPQQSLSFVPTEGFRCAAAVLECILRTINKNISFNWRQWDAVFRLSTDHFAWLAQTAEVAHRLGFNVTYHAAPDRINQLLDSDIKAVVKMRCGPGVARRTDPLRVHASLRYLMRWL